MVDLRTSEPIIVLRFLPPYRETDERAYLDALAVLSSITAPFALLTIFQGGRKLSVAGEREQALWFKASRAHMNAHCRGLAIVRPAAAPRMKAAFSKLWRFPVEIFQEEVEAWAYLGPKLGALA